MFNDINKTLFLRNSYGSNKRWPSTTQVLNKVVSLYNLQQLWTWLNQSEIKDRNDLLYKFTIYNGRFIWQLD